jgi:hypothetical protein
MNRILIVDGIVIIEISVLLRVIRRGEGGRVAVV